MRRSILYKVLDGAAVQAITSSTNATPIEVTKATHGLVTGDRITIVGHTTNTNANGTWTVTKTGTNTFTLDGSVGNGVGGATGCFAPAAAVMDVRDAETVVISLDSSSGATMTLRAVGSIAEDMPDFAEAQSQTIRYENIAMVDLQSGSTIAGDTGVAISASEDHRLFEVNVNGLRWLSILPVSGSAGTVTVYARLFMSEE